MRFKSHTKKLVIRTVWTLCMTSFLVIRRPIVNYSKFSLKQCEMPWSYKNCLKNYVWRGQDRVRGRKNVSRENRSQNLLDWLRCSCEIVHYGKILISVFEEVFASIKKILILPERSGTRLLLYEVYTLYWYFLIS